MDKILPLLSTKLKNILTVIYEIHKCPISLDLLTANHLINKLIVLQRSSKDILSFNTIEFMINQIVNDSVRMLSYRSNSFLISYLPKDKQYVYNDRGEWSLINRQTAKPARIIQKLLVKNYTNRDFENFSNWIKAEIMNCDFILVSGKEITKWYNEENYYNSFGSLGNSCMRYDKCKEYFKIYEDYANMLITLRNNSLVGRAIVWNINNNIYMDRIYTSFEYLENQFIEYARNNNWNYRINNQVLVDKNYQGWYTSDDHYLNTKIFNIKINLKNKYKYMPYMDSFRYYNIEDNSINTSPTYGNIYLSNTDGLYL